MDTCHLFPLTSVADQQWQFPGQVAGETSAYEMQSDKEIGHTDSQTAQCGLILKDGLVLVTSLSVLSLDNEDVGITEVNIAPAAYDPATGAAKISEVTRFVNLTVKNTGLKPHFWLN